MNPYAGGKLIQACLQKLHLDVELNKIPIEIKWRFSKVMLGYTQAYMTVYDIAAPYQLNELDGSSLSKFLEMETHPLKDDIYWFQKQITPNVADDFIDALAKRYYNEKMLDLTIVFIDGHAIAYFGKARVLSGYHTTRGRVMPVIVYFGANDADGKPILFTLKPGDTNIREVIPELIVRIRRVLGDDKVKLVVFDRSGFKVQLYLDLVDKYVVDFISMVIKNPAIVREINEIPDKRYEDYRIDRNGKVTKKIAEWEVTIKGETFRCGIIWNLENDIKYVLVTSIKDTVEKDIKKIADKYPLHWRQENYYKETKNSLKFDKLARYDLISIPNRNLEKKKRKLEASLRKTKKLLISLRKQVDKHQMDIMLIESNLKKPRNKKGQIYNVKALVKKLKNEITDLVATDQKIKENQKKKSRLEKEINDINLDTEFYTLNLGATTYRIGIINTVLMAHEILVQHLKDKDQKMDFKTARRIIYTHPGWERIEAGNHYVVLAPFRTKHYQDSISLACEWLNSQNIKDLKGNIYRFKVLDGSRKNKMSKIFDF